MCRSGHCPDCNQRCGQYWAGVKAKWWRCDGECHRCQWPKCQKYRTLFKWLVDFGAPVKILAQGRQVRVFIGAFPADSYERLRRQAKRIKIGVANNE